MQTKNKEQKDKAILPMNYENYVFDLYGTLVDIRTEENARYLWEKLSLFYGYYNARYTAKELQKRYLELVEEKQIQLKEKILSGEKNQLVIRNDSHEACPEIEITDVFWNLYKEKGVEVERAHAVYTGQFFRILSTEHLNLYKGTEKMMECLKGAGKKIYLLSNAQRIFTEYEMNLLDLTKYFDGILISSDYETRKPHKRFFELLEQKFHIDVSKSLFIGNDSKTDIAGAKQLGMETFYVHSDISPQNDAAPDATYQMNDFKHW